MAVVGVDAFFPTPSVVANVVGAAVDIESTGCDTNLTKTEAVHFAIAVSTASFLCTYTRATRLQLVARLTSSAALGALTDALFANKTSGAVTVGYA